MKKILGVQSAPPPHWVGSGLSLARMKAVTSAPSAFL